MYIHAQLTCSRGGTRGGAADFSWDVVKEDKHRENYLGNSVAAPRGRWAQGRDILWYSKGHKDDTDKDQAKRKEELLAIKMAEQEAMNQLLYVQSDSQRSGQSGQARTKRAPHVGNALTQGSQETAQRTGANAAPIDPTKRRYPAPRSPTEPRSPRRHDERHRSRHEEDRHRRHRHDRDKRYERDTDRRRERDYERRHEREVSPHRRPRHDGAERSRRER